MNQSLAPNQTQTDECSRMSEEVNGSTARWRVRTPLALAVAGLGSLVRLAPHPWNLSPSYAVEIFAGARLRAWHAFALALGIRGLCDLLIYLFPFPGQEGTARFYLSFLPWVYLSVVLNVVLGRLVRNTETSWKIGGVTLLAALQFFVITNFGTWIGSEIYPKNATGLLECYLAALPWFRNQFISYLVFVPVLFGAYAALVRMISAREHAAAAEAH
jgi:hypothetical protein